MNPSTTPQARRFLTAEWRHLAMLNYEIDPSALAPFVPAGTEPDVWEGKTLVSMVGFLFLKTRVHGFSIPFHREFEEVNLRFYVRRKAEDGWRRGVVFIKEIVPRLAIAVVARKFYNEPYVALPMSHRVVTEGDAVRSVEYAWQLRRRRNCLTLTTEGDPKVLVEESEAAFITEHYWGYNSQPNGATLEYRVEHPPWRVYDAVHAELNCDVEALYGRCFADSLSHAPTSAFLAEGSAVIVHRGVRLTN